MKHYRPLPDCLTIKPSGIDGLGLFATEDILRGTDLGMTHCYSIYWDLARTPLGGFYNHSDDPNCENFSDGYKNNYLRTIKDIKSGEELTVQYKLYNPTK